MSVSGFSKISAAQVLKNTKIPSMKVTEMMKIEKSSSKVVIEWQKTSILDYLN